MLQESLNADRSINVSWATRSNSNAEKRPIYVVGLLEKSEGCLRKKDELAGSRELRSQRVWSALSERVLSALSRRVKESVETVVTRVVN